MRLCDLHCHLGGSTSPSTLRSIAYDRGLKISPVDFDDFSDLIKHNEGIGKTSAGDFVDYLNRYKLIQKITSSPMGIKESVFSAIRDAYINNNIGLLELKINPMLRNADKLYDVDAIIGYACEGLHKAKTIFNINCGLIIESDRSFSPKLSMILAKKAAEFKNRGVVGFDISGHKEGYNVLEHLAAIEYAKSNGLGITLHAGEIAFEDDFLRFDVMSIVDRIGHGVQYAGCRSTLNHIAKINNGITFELCPISNINTGIVKQSNVIAYFDEIITNLNNAGLNWTINSDGFVFNGSISDNISAIYGSCYNGRPSIVNSYTNDDFNSFVAKATFLK